MNDVPLPIEAVDYCELLRKACFNIRIEKNEAGAYEWGTGFFISPNGLALTARHNMPEGIQDQGLVDIYYRREFMKARFLERYSLPGEEGDIAVLQLSTENVLIDYLTLAYYDATKPIDRRRRFWSGREIYIYGYPIRDQGLAGIMIRGSLDASDPITEHRLPDENGIGPNIVGTREWLKIASEDDWKLSGISGGPIYDTKSNRVIGVEHRYTEEWLKVLGTDLGQLIAKRPAFLALIGEKNVTPLHEIPTITPLKKWQKLWPVIVAMVMIVGSIPFWRKNTVEGMVVKIVYDSEVLSGTASGLGQALEGMKLTNPEGELIPIKTLFAAPLKAAEQSEATRLGSVCLYYKDRGNPAFNPIWNLLKQPNLQREGYQVKYRYHDSISEDFVIELTAAK